METHLLSRPGSVLNHSLDQVTGSVQLVLLLVGVKCDDLDLLGKGLLAVVPSLGLFPNAKTKLA